MPSVWAEMTLGIRDYGRPDPFQGQGFLGCRREAEERRCGIHVLRLRRTGRPLLRRGNRSQEDY